MRMARPSSVRPALLTSASTGPASLSMSSKARSTASAWATSAGYSVLLRDSVTTRQPSSRRRWAIAAPIPRLPPVTSATPSSCADKRALLPADDPGRPHEPRAEGGQRHRGAGKQATLPLSLPQRQRNRGRGGVGDAVDVEHHAIGGHAHGGCRSLDDAGVGLM